VLRNVVVGIYTGFSWLDVGTVTNSWEDPNTLPYDIKCREYLDNLSYSYLLCCVDLQDV